MLHFCGHFGVNYLVCIRGVLGDYCLEAAELGFPELLGPLQISYALLLRFELLRQVFVLGRQALVFILKCAAPLL